MTRWTDTHLTHIFRRSASAVSVAGLLALIWVSPLQADTDQSSLDRFIERARSEHWAFQPIDATWPRISLEHSGWDRTGVDRFVAARLREASLEPSSEAERRVLLRRLSFDLHGLPPSNDETKRFVADTSPAAYERLVDRMLTSPRYGERWGRHWLDVARYADTKGYVFTAEPRYAFSYTYRDYVVTAFNADRPYDQFVREQIAADTLEASDRSTLAALGFLTLGRRFGNKIHDIIDDRIDVTMRGLLGLTVTCSRCHDHKYDPISMADYYALYGIFASAEEPEKGPLICSEEEFASHPRYPQFSKELAKRQRDADNYVEKKRQEFVLSGKTSAVDYIAAAIFSRDEDARAAGLTRPRGELNRFFLDAVKALVTAAHENPGAPLRAWLNLTPEAFAEKSASDRKLLAAIVERQGAIRDGEPPEEAQLRTLLYGESTPFQLSHDEALRSFNRKHRDEHRTFTNAIASLHATHDGAPPRAMSLHDRPLPVNPRIFERGNPKRPGATVPRRFLTVLSSSDAGTYESAGRRDLVRDITEKNSALLARVFVNRVWAHHFRRGLVRTPGDFGYRGARPTHPRLLDWLAQELIRSNWSVKHVQRLIVLSATYRQSSHIRRDASRIDPENELLWRMPRKRLDFESTRDALLAVSGDLDLRSGGKSVDLLSRPFSRRRTLYGFVDRQNLPGLFRNFDFANPDESCPQRHQTTVPQQALFLMNGEFVDERSRSLAARVSGKTLEDGITALFELTLSRPPEREELARATRFFQHDASEAAWARFAHVLLMSNEFAMID